MKKIKTPKVTKPKKKIEKKEKEKVEEIPANKRLYIKLPSNYEQSILISLREAIDIAPGATEVVLVIGEGEQRQIIKLPMTISENTSDHESIKKIVGSQNVKLQ